MFNHELDRIPSEPEGEPFAVEDVDELIRLVNGEFARAMFKDETSMMRPSNRMVYLSGLESKLIAFKARLG